MFRCSHHHQGAHYSCKHEWSAPWWWCDCIETCQSCFDVNFKVNFETVFKTIRSCFSWWIKKLWYILYVNTRPSSKTNLAKVLVFVTVPYMLIQRATKAGQGIFNLLAPELFFLILAYSVYKMWIILEPNKLELWNKLHFKEKKTENIHHV